MARKIGKLTGKVSLERRAMRNLNELDHLRPPQGVTIFLLYSKGKFHTI
jgi:hypothetical protein